MAEEEPGSEPTHNQQSAEADTMTEKEDEKKLRKGGAPYGFAVRDGRRALWTFIIIFLVLAGITVLIVWLIYRPHKPNFRVVSAAVYELNTTSDDPPFIYTTMQFTLVTRNPNKRVSILYDQLSAFVSYKNQAITPKVILPPLFHKTKSTVALSPVLGGSTVPVAAEVVNGLVMEEANYGVVGLRLVLTGKLRYKAALIRSGHYGIYVRCNMFVGLKKGFVGQLPPLPGSPACRVDV